MADEFTEAQLAYQLGASIEFEGLMDEIDEQTHEINDLVTALKSLMQGDCWCDAKDFDEPCTDECAFIQSVMEDKMQRLSNVEIFMRMNRLKKDTDDDTPA